MSAPIARELPALIDEHRRRIAGLVEEADVRLSGSASVRGLDPNDLDLVVLVPDVAAASARLRTEYPPLFEDEWREDWAAFRELGPPQVDIVVTRVGTCGDAHHRLAWELLAADAELLAEYRALKSSGDRYEERKAAFFERIVERLPEHR